MCLTKYNPPPPQVRLIKCAAKPARQTMCEECGKKVNEIIKADFEIAYNRVRWEWDGSYMPGVGDDPRQPNYYAQVKKVYEEKLLVSRRVCLECATRSIYPVDPH